MHERFVNVWIKGDASIYKFGETQFCCGVDQLVSYRFKSSG